VAHSEPSNTEVEERRAGRLEVEAAFLHLTEIGKEPGEDHAPLADEGVQIREKLFVGQSRQIHNLLLPSRFLALVFGPKRRSDVSPPRATSRERTACTRSPCARAYTFRDRLAFTSAPTLQNLSIGISRRRSFS